jgi:capsular exopolysaccharide synthesis family protein
MALGDRRRVSVGDLMENKVESQQKIETIIRGNNGQWNGNFSPPQMARLAQIPDDPNFPLLLPQREGENHNNIVALESFGILRSRLLSVHKKLGIQSVVITSAEAGDGKTIVACNIAMSLGQLGNKRVLLVDGDLRAGHATRILKLRHLPGIGDFLQGDKPFEAVIHMTGFPSLSIAPTGLVRKQALPEILEGPRWSEFLEQAKQSFELIIVDSLPASAPIADLELLATPCDAILLVVHMRRTHRAALKRASGRLDPKKFLGVIINNSDEIYDYDYRYYGLRSQEPKQSPTGAGPEPGSRGRTGDRRYPIRFWRTK